MIVRKFILLTTIIIGVTVASAQDEAQDDSVTTDIAATTSNYYEPPDLDRHWDLAKKQIEAFGSEPLSSAEMLKIIESLENAIVLDVDSLINRVRAFEGAGGGGYSHKYFASPLTRQKILGNEISAKIAKRVPHFHAIYGPMGHLLRIRYIEPSRWRARQKALAEGDYQAEPGTVPLVRYFGLWDLKERKGRGYLKKKKRIEGQAYYRGLYGQSDEIIEVQRYDKSWNLLYTIDYSQPSDEGKNYSELRFAGDGSGSLLTVDPFLFIGQYSLVKPGWTVAITSDENSELASIQVFNNYDQLSYYYTYSNSVDDETRVRTLRGTTLTAAGEISQVFSVIFDKKNRMEQRIFYTESGEVIKSITYTYPRRGKTVSAVTKNAAGIVTGQHTIIDPAQAN